MTVMMSQGLMSHESDDIPGLMSHEGDDFTKFDVSYESYDVNRFDVIFGC